MNNKILIKKAENQVRQQLIGGLMLMVAGLMIINTFVGLPKWTKAADVTNLTFNITAGAFTIVNVPNSMAFPSQPYATANVITGNEEMDGVTVTDYRGNAQTWTVALNSNSLTDTTDANFTISANRMNAYAETGTISNIQNGTTTYTSVGTNGLLNDGGITLLNGSTQASGIFQYDNGKINLTVWSTDASGTYQAVLTYTLS
ncbi:MAG: hypothetical protein ABH836_03475 [Candidatus Omnitrophota bacterium]